MQKCKFKDFCCSNKFSIALEEKKIIFCATRMLILYDTVCITTQSRYQTVVHREGKRKA
jgi:hypothetical protein